MRNGKVSVLGLQPSEGEGVQSELMSPEEVEPMAKPQEVRTKEWTLRLAGSEGRSPHVQILGQGGNKRKSLGVGAFS